MDSASKQLFVDGKFIGDVPSTGNLEKDLQAATDLMKAKGYTASSRRRK